MNLIQMLQGAMTPETLGQIGSMVGLSPEITRTAATAALPVILGGLANTASTSGGTATLTNMLTSGPLASVLTGMSGGTGTGTGTLAGTTMAGATTSPMGGLGGLLDGLGGLLGTGAAAGATGGNALTSIGGTLLGTLFGGNEGAVASAVGTHAGIGQGQAQSLLATLAPILLAFVGRQLAGTSGVSAVTPSALQSLLGDQREHIAGALPADMRAKLGAIPGLGALFGGLGTAAAGIGAAATGMAGSAATGLGSAAAATGSTASAATAAAAGGIGRWLPWLALLLGLLALGWYLLKHRTHGRIDPNATVESCTGEFRTALAGGTVNFAPAAATVTTDSTPLLDKLADIAGRCGAYKIEVQGHTDETGGPNTDNMALSRARAQAVVTYLKTHGVEDEQLTGVGYGSTKPVDASGTPEANAKNRRIEFVVSK